ncbi:hypothetical protein AQZ52_15830 [Novosphingobium fuchskuhlense]|uniref:Uncharacterized protein n=2 Tax=Novosphingobium fuchskuhlense TaxID=1117702 RepID=A0A117USZ8_9SPHN|nr:hypothetical protein AQZ52_15830 [Novosphingobium fuchskuhlense]
MTKLALLGATAFLATTSAHAQVADTWSIAGNVTVGSVNSETVTLDPVNGGGATLGVDGANIGDGFKNSISASAVGSSASSSFTTVNNSGVGGDASLGIDGSVGVGASNASAVTQTSDVLTSATIVQGNSNSISLAAVGSSASASASTTVTDVGGATIGSNETFSYTVGGGLTVSSGLADGTVAPVDVAGGDLGGGNSGAVALTLGTGVAGADIQAGTGNSISVAGVGSSASASFSATVSGDGTVLDSALFDLSGGDTKISAANDTTGAVSVGVTTVATPKIEGGAANSISGAAVGSSASLSFAAATFDSGAISDFSATTGVVGVDSTNAAAVTFSGDGTTGTAATLDGAAISGTGLGNSISLSAVGSSGSVSFTNTVYGGANGAAGGSVAFDDITVNSTNSGAVSNISETITGSGIDGGSKNSISIAGVGASASQSISVTDYTGGGITGVGSTLNNVTVSGNNSGAVLVAGGLATPNIDGGFSNSISAAAVGASASQAISRTLVGAQ